MLAIGIDPGLTGAMTLLGVHGELLDIMDMPTCDSGLETGRMRSWLDLGELSIRMHEWSSRFTFASWGVQAVIERPIPMPSLPASTLATQFETFGALRAVMAQHASITHVVSPSKWKAMYAIGRDKDESRRVCKALFPDAPVDRKKDHNRAESALLAHWLYKTELS